jgi:hypothetical protein
MTDRRIPAAAAVVLASAIGVAGMIAHNVLEFGPDFGPDFLGSAETLIPVGIFGLLALLAWARPANTVVHVALVAWALLNLVGGGILSVLPLGLFPFEPGQSLGHYGAHVIYAAGQIPLVVVAARALRPRRTGSVDAHRLLPHDPALTSPPPLPRSKEKECRANRHRECG